MDLDERTGEQETAEIVPIKQPAVQRKRDVSSLIMHLSIAAMGIAVLYVSCERNNVPSPDVLQEAPSYDTPFPTYDANFK